MRSIEPLDVDDVALYDGVTAEKRVPRRGHMQSARAMVLAAYEDYVERAPVLENVAATECSEVENEALRHAYDEETKSFKEFRAKNVFRADAVRCPFCGLSESSTLDHYLPKELNPQFSIFPQNLVPCCPTCNTKKRDKVLDEHTQIRMFLHPYFDEVPDIVFLHVDVQLDAEELTLTWSVFPAEGLLEERFLQLESHFQQLDLKNRYRLMSLDFLSVLRLALRRNYGANENAQRVVDELLLLADDESERYGENYWKAVLLRELAGNPVFCDGGFRVLDILN